MKPSEPLRLRAVGAEDVPVISAALQDAVGKLGEFLYEAEAKRFTFALNRYRWEAAGRRGRGERVRTGVQIGAVLAAKSKRIKRDAPDAVVSLLAIQFEPAGEDQPGGEIVLHFAGGGEIRLSVECVDIALADLSEPWRAARRPDHDKPAGESTGAGGRAGS